MTRGVVTQPNRGWLRGRKRGDFGKRNGPTKWLEWSGGGPGRIGASGAERA